MRSRVLARPCEQRRVYIVAAAGRRNQRDELGETTPRQKFQPLESLRGNREGQGAPAIAMEEFASACHAVLGSSRNDLIGLGARERAMPWEGRSRVDCG